MFDFLIVGSGLYGAVFAHECRKKGFKCLVLERRDHIGGNLYCKNVNDIEVHWYGAHIFHTSSPEIWDYMNQFAQFNRYTNSPMAFYKENLYNLPFNMNTFYQLWGTKTPAEARLKIEEQTARHKGALPANLEEAALQMVGEDIYFKLVKGYTEKQWGKKATEIPAFIIKRIPLRFIFDNNYFNDPFQGIPKGGYNVIIERLLEDITVHLKTDFLENRDHWMTVARKIIFSGEIDRFFNYKLGKLEYRSLQFEHKLLTGTSNYQGNAVINYTDAEVPYTRIIEHKHFDFGTQKDTFISYEYSADFKDGLEPYYPINDEKNNTLYQRYKEEAKKLPQVHFGGRLGSYRYYNMDQVVAEALKDSRSLLISLT
ncbi:UDP-galactopyranose mutase [Sunxiuqinia dokdonensis]|uniref:UDP-galactopyranose mutase n=1 Tax=Sunxiuqinia dokdonensis TaxID=1409788 RepID=A0A0L8V4P9_9BACT|nr:UDP-galactopyranose mutase [Sunxiuqinia dokdonensis]KOH43333.1 UDP-galactopyranose mutase [Sunxiuqinia dokdonensis]